MQLCSSKEAAQGRQTLTTLATQDDGVGYLARRALGKSTPDLHSMALEGAKPKRALPSPQDLFKKWMELGKNKARWSQAVEGLDALRAAARRGSDWYRITLAQAEILERHDQIEAASRLWVGMFLRTRGWRSAKAVERDFLAFERRHRLDLRDLQVRLDELRALVEDGQFKEARKHSIEVAKFAKVSGDERFSRTQRQWSQWCRQADIDDPLQVPGSGPIAFGSFTFDPDPSSQVSSLIVIPRIVLGRRDGRSWITVVGDDEPSLPPVSVPAAPTRVDWAAGSRSAQEWQQSVADVIARIGRGELDKVVLARDIVAEVSADFDPRYLLQRLEDAYPECWTFQVGDLVGATPELLVRRTGDDVLSRVLAGTVKRRGDETEDASLAAALLGSGKDLEEHEYAVHSVARALAAHCTDLDVPDRPHVLRLANVQHLATDVQGKLADNAPAIALAASLHPTAAVCGTPTERAFATIRELEGMDRGRYAGPVGWFDSRGDGEFGIALRCAQVQPDHLRLYAGCGIVAGSDPDAELAESRAKFLPIRQALGN